jgi:putative Holliday junction resolvase
VCVNKKKILGIDYGDFTIGLAILDVETDFIYPYKTIYRERAGAIKKSIREIIDIVANEGITDIVIGYPLNMDDTEGERIEKVKSFKNELEKRLAESSNRRGEQDSRGELCEPASIYFQDERLSTIEAREILRSRGIKKEDEKKYIDQVAAEIILNDYKRSKHE